MYWRLPERGPSGAACAQPAAPVCPFPVTCVHASAEYPRPRRHGGFDEPLPEDLLQLRLQLEVLQAPVDRDQKLGELQLPFLGHQV